MQLLAGAPHQVLALRQSQAAVALELLGQLAQQLGLGRRTPLGGLTQFAGHKGMEWLAAPLQIAKAALSLQQQPLLQRTQPGLNRQRVSAGGIGDGALS